MMPAIQYHVDTCNTAEEALAAAAAVRERRKAWAAPAARVMAPPPAAPQRIPEIAIPKLPAKLTETGFPAISGTSTAHFEISGGEGTEISLSSGTASPTIKAIQVAVCNAAGVSMMDLVSPRRVKHLIRARHVAMMLCKRLTGRSYPEIGRRFGGRDHTTVLHALEKMAPVIAAIEPHINANAPLPSLAALSLQYFDRLQRQAA